MARKIKEPEAPMSRKAKRHLKKKQSKEPDVPIRKPTFKAKEKRDYRKQAKLLNEKHQQEEEQNSLVREYLKNKSKKFDNPVWLKRDKTRTIFVGGLTFNLSEEDLRKLFSQCGNIEEVRLPKRTVKGVSGTRGFAYIQYENADCVAKAVEKFNNRKFGDKTFYVCLETEKKDDKEEEIV